jgi:hypothetical protein
MDNQSRNYHTEFLPYFEPSDPDQEMKEALEWWQGLSPDLKEEYVRTYLDESWTVELVNVNEAMIEKLYIKATKLC